MITEEAQEMGSRIRQARRVRGMTQEALAAAAGVSRDAVLRLEHGSPHSRPSTVAKVTEALGLTAEDFEGGEPGERPRKPRGAPRERRVKATRGGEPAAEAVSAGRE